MEAPATALYLYPQFANPSSNQKQNQQQQQELQVPSGDLMFYGYKKPISLTGSSALHQAQQMSESVHTGRPETANVLLVNNASTLLGPDPQAMTCPQCNVRMLTRLDFRASYRTHIFAFVLCITGLFCLVPLPYCMKSCKQRYHFCGNCDAFLGKSTK